MLDKTKLDLNAPAFGQGAQSLKDLEPAESSVEEGQGVKEEEESVEPEGETKVPYSRFKKFHDEAKQAREEAEEWRRRVEELESQRQPYREPEETTDMPSYWRELYGDSEASQKAWQIQKRRDEEIFQAAYEAGLKGAEELEVKQQKALESNINVIDENFEMLAGALGRELTAKEQSAVLDIVDDFTPKDEKGRYVGPLISFEKAWEMYELKNSASSLNKKQSRDSVASLSAMSSQGGDVSSESKKDFTPGAWRSWKNRL